MNSPLLPLSLFVFSAAVFPVQAGTVLDIDFSMWHDRIGDPSGLGESARVQDRSGNNHHGLLAGGTITNDTPVITSPAGTGIDSTLTEAHVIVRKELAVDEPGWSPAFSGTTPAHGFTVEPGKSYTFEAVLNWQGDADLIDGIFGQQHFDISPGGGSSEFFIHEYNGVLVAMALDSANNGFRAVADVSTLIANRDWHHVGVVIDRAASEVKIYFDYRLIDTHSDPGIAGLQNMGDGSSDLRLGSSGDLSFYGFSGQQARYRISDEVLLPASFIQIPVSTATTLTWTGGAGSTWDQGSTESWKLPNGNGSVFSAGNTARFDESAATGAVQVDHSQGTVDPFCIEVSNPVLPYSFGGAPITGETSLLKQGGGTLTLLANNTYQGSTHIRGGTLIAGDGATSGEIGSGPVSLWGDGVPTRLVIKRSDMLDYSSGNKLKRIGGDGWFTIDGGCTLKVHPEAGFAPYLAGIWADFQGVTEVIGGSELQTSGDAFIGAGMGRFHLGNASSGGALAQYGGNGVMTRSLIVTGPGNKLINRSPAGSNARSMVFTGDLSGTGDLTVQDAAGTMNDPDMGFVLATEYYTPAWFLPPFTGRITVSPNTPLRLGGDRGLPPGNRGRLGDTATIHNEGILTFSHTSRKVLSNPISGTGLVRIGLTRGGTESQTIVFPNDKAYTGNTSVVNGELEVHGRLASQLVEVKAAGKLSGNSIGMEALSILGNLEPGTAAASNGSFTCNGTVSFQAGSTYTWSRSVWGGVAQDQDHLLAPNIVFAGTAGNPVTVLFDASFLIGQDESSRRFTVANTSAGISGFDPATVKVGLGSFPGAGTWALELTPDGKALEAVYTPSNLPDHEAWLSKFPGLSDTAGAADPDGDGRSNDDEYAFGLNPADAGSARPVVIPPSPVAGVFEYVRRDNAITGCSFSYQWSSTLSEGSWQPLVPALPEQETPLPGSRNERVTVPLQGVAGNPLGASKLFIRVVPQMP